MMFTFRVDGIEKTLQDLENIFSPSNIKRVQDTALKEGAEFMRKKIREAQLRTKDTGAMANEVTFSDPQGSRGYRYVAIHWRGEKDRFRVVHLVENGFFHVNSGKFVKPAGYGQLENVLSANENAYLEIVRNSIERQIVG